MNILQRVEDMLDRLPSADDDSRKRKQSDDPQIESPPTKKRKLENGSAASSNNEAVKLKPPSLLEFAYLMGNLKKTERTGWLRRGIHKPESIADHMYRMGILSWIFGEQFGKYSKEHVDLDKDKMIKMAIVHDIIESVCGDIVPGTISKDSKHDIELKAMIKIRDEYLKKSAVGQEMYDLWMEYEGQETVESHIVKDLDKLDMIIQAEEYEMEPKNNNVDLEEFFKGTRGVFKTEVGKAVDKELMEQRQRRLLLKSQREDGDSNTGNK